MIRRMHAPRRLALVLAPVFASMLVVACGGGSSGSGATRTVLADYNVPGRSNAYQAFFPRFVTAHPGDTIRFRQAWTGDPHTVTLGTSVDKAMAPVLPYLKGQPLPPGGPPANVTNAFAALPSFFSPDVNQLAAQPCYIASGSIPTGTKPCPKAQRREPAFDGTQTFFNSGFIPYAGNNGNRFDVKLSDDIKPGEYAFYCVVHGPQMGGAITVKPRSVKVPGQSSIDTAALRQLNRFADELDKLHAAFVAHQTAPPGEDILAGAAPPAGSLDSFDLREFYPSTFHAKVGQKVTWYLSTQPAHTVSFRVPSYVSVITVAKDGTVSGNPDTTEPRNGPGYPQTDAPPPTGDQLPAPVTVDAGSYDGSKFLSSGANFQGPMFYSVTFTKPGTYNYACLLHPRMVGKVVVS
ncbi:MAG: hypothetical protein JO087_16660 [Actinobacteria bacterium]|nr:hypothetical protein [Actinomycetota bacterium]